MKNWRTSSTFRITLAYLVIGAVWILLSDRAAALLFEDPNSLSIAQTYKGWFFIVVTAGILHILILKSQSAQKRSEQNFSDLFESTTAGIFRSSPDGRYIKINSAMASIYGYASADEMLEKINDISAQIHASPESRRNFTELLKKDGFVEKFQARNIKKDGSFIWTSTNAHIVKDQNGNTLYYEGFVTDITKQRDAEIALRESEAQYRMVVEQASDGIIVAELAGTIFKANQQLCSLLGYSRNELLNLTLDELLANESAHPWASNGFTRGRTIVTETALKRKDGTLLLTELSMRSLPNNLMIGIVRNISNRKLVEESLARSEQKFRALIENSTDAIALYSADGKIIFQSPAAQRILGYTLEEMIGKNAFDFICEEDRDKARSALHQLITNPRENIALEIRCVCKDGNLKWVEVNGKNHLDEAGIESLVANYRDITERKIYENAIFEAEERYRLLVEKLPAVVFMDKFGDVQINQYISPRIQDLLGYSVEEWVADNTFWRNSLHPDDRERVLAEDSRTNITGEDFRIEYRLRHRDGHYVWIKEDASVIRDENGSPLFWHGILVDITAGKLAEEAVKRRDEILKAVGFSAEQLLMSLNWEESVGRVLARLGQTTDASRVYIFRKEKSNKDETLASQVYEWCNAGIAPQINNKDLQNLNLGQEGYARWVKYFDQGLPIVGRINNFPAKEQKLLREQGILSLICIPIKADDDWWGFIGFDDCKIAREWTEVDIEALRAAANTLGASIERKTNEEALSNSEISYRGLFNAVGDAIYIQDKNGCFLDVNDGAAQMYGYPKEYFIGKTPEFLGAPGKNDLNKLSQALQAAFRGEPQQFEFWGLRSNGDIFPKDVRLYQGVYFGQEVVLALAQDVTARKQAEDDLQKQLRELTVLHSATLAEATARDADTLIQQVTDIISDTLYSDNCGVLLLNDARDAFIPHYSYRGTDIEMIGDSLPISHGISGRVASTGRSLRIDNVLHEPIYFKVSESTRSELCVPIMSGKKIYGVLNVESKKVKAFTERDEKLLNTIAGGMANALERIQLFELEKRRRMETEDLSHATASLANAMDIDDLLEKILDWLKQLAPYDSASIMLKQDQLVRFVASRGLPENFQIGREFPMTEKWGRVAATRKPLIIEDAQQDDVFEKWAGSEYIRGWMGVAMFVQDTLIGFINLDSRTAGTYTQEHAVRVQTFANQAATAIDKTRLFELEKKRRETAEIIRQAATALTNLLDLSALHTAILEWLYKIAPYDSASILEIEGEDNVRITAAKGLPNPKKALNRVFSTDNLLCRIINETRQTLIIDDCRSDARFENWGDSQHVRGWMGVPLIARGEVIGYLTVDSRTPNAFTQSDAIAAQTFAYQAATCLENTRLYTETRQRLEELEMVNRVSFALRAAKDINEMLTILINELKTSIGTDAATIFLYDTENDEITAHSTSGGVENNLPKKTFKPGEGIIGTVFSSGTPHTSVELIEDPLAIPENANFFGKGWGSIAVPIRTAKETIGVIMIAVQKPRKMEEHLVRLITTLAEIAGNAIHRSNLFEQNEEQIRRLTTLREMDTAITSSLDLHVTLDILTEYLLSKMRASAVRILVFNPDSQMLDCYSANGFKNQITPRNSIGIGEGRVSQILLNRKELYIKDIQQENPELQPQILSSEGFRSYYAMPLFSKGATRGIIETYFRYTFSPTKDWVDFLKTLAGQATIAIDNAQLFENLQRTNQELSLAYDTTLEGWGKALELRDKETQGHTRRVTNLTLELARQMGIPSSELPRIRRGALLHDIGKMGVPDNILHKPGPLTKEETEEMRKHPQYAYDLLSPITYLRSTLDIAYCHHEWWDGNGYPRGIKGEEIPLSARIFAVVDVWDALLSDRPYRRAWQDEDVMKYITDLSGRQFDPRVVEKFKGMIGSKTRFINTNPPKKTRSSIKKKSGKPGKAAAKNKKVR